MNHRERIATKKFAEYQMQHYVRRHGLRFNQPEYNDRVLRAKRGGIIQQALDHQREFAAAVQSGDFSHMRFVPLELPSETAERLYESGIFTRLNPSAQYIQPGAPEWHRFQQSLDGE